jgi:GH24 family phage-related lysozyme (muramidase)
MTFSSAATTPSEYLGDFMDHMVAHRKKSGIINPSVGVTSQLPRPQSVEDVLNTLGSLTGARAQRRGGGLFDMTTYGRQRKDFVTRHEGTRERAYDDATGKPYEGGPKQGNITVGVGMNMDAPGARERWKAAGIPENFDAVYAGKAPLSKQSTQALLDVSLVEAEKVIADKFRGINLRDHERIALVSLAFNSPALIGPNLVSAFQRGDRKAAAYEVLYKSNAKNHRGLARRRYYEASQLVGNNIDGFPPFAQYIKDYA